MNLEEFKAGRARRLQDTLSFIQIADEDECVSIEDALMKRMTELGFTNPEDDDKEDTSKIECPECGTRDVK